MPAAQTFHITVTTDGGIPSGRDYASEADARAYGDMCLGELGCIHYRIKADGKAVAAVVKQGWSAWWQA